MSAMSSRWLPGVGAFALALLWTTVASAVDPDINFPSQGEQIAKNSPIATAGDGNLNDVYVVVLRKNGVVQASQDVRAYFGGWSHTFMAPPGTGWAVGTDWVCELWGSSLLDAVSFSVVD
jgi:hypothetical protein